MPEKISILRTLTNKAGIRGKIILLIITVALVVMMTGGLLGFFKGRALLRETVVNDHHEMAEILAATISELIDINVENAKVILSDVHYRAFIEEANSSYDGISQSDVQKKLIKTDEEWINAADDSPLIGKYLKNTESMNLSMQTRGDRHLVEIFFTDKYGGLVAASNRTSDFFQADEEWWQKSYADGKGSVYVGNVEFDESANLLSIALGIPVFDENGKVIGVGKVIIGVNNFFKTIEYFKTGKTGHAVLFDKDNNVIYHHGIEPLTKKLTNDKDFRELLSTKRVETKDPHWHKEKLFITAADVKNTYLIANGIQWMVCIDQNASEVFRPVTIFLIDSFLFSLLGLMLLIPIAFILGTRFIKPIKELQEATEHIAQGELNYRIDIRTGDEIQSLADSFNDMAKNLVKTFSSIAILEKQTDEHKRIQVNLGERVKELTCIYGLLDVTTKHGVGLDDIFTDLVKQIPYAWQYPEITCARITFRGQEYKSNNFSDTKWVQSTDIMAFGEKAGSIEVYYSEVRYEESEGEGPFLKEERDLINALAKQLGMVIERNDEKNG